MPTITLTHVSKQFSLCSHETLSDISLTFCQGLSYVIMGESGSGKSTLLSIITKTDTPSQGIVHYAAHSSIGILLQSPLLIHELSVIENIMLPGLIRGLDQKKDFQRAQELLHAVDLANYQTYYPAMLSGGQQQRIALARALFLHPTFLIADEPTSSLDAQSAHQIINLLFGLCKEHGIALIIATHDTRIADRADNVLTIHNGKITNSI